MLSRDSKLVFVALAMWGVGEGLYFYIQPLYMKRLGADPVQIGLLLAIAGVSATVSYIPGGLIADRISRRTTMLGGWVLGAIGAWLMAAAQTWWQLIPGIAVYAVSAFCLPAISAYITHAESENDLGAALATVWAGYSLGQIFSPSIGGLIGQYLGMRVVFFLSGCVFALSGVVVSRISDQPVTPPRVAENYRRLLTNSHFLSLAALFLAVFLFLYLGQPFAPNYLEEVVGLDLAWIGALGSAASLGAVVLGIGLGRLPWRTFSRLTLGQALMVLSLVLLLQGKALPMLAVSFFLRGAWNASRALATAQLGSILDQQTLGLGYGVLNTTVGAAMIVAPYLAGRLYTLRPALPFEVAIGGMVITALLTLLVGAHLVPVQSRTAVAEHVQQSQP